MKTEGNIDQFTHTVNCKLAKVKTAICISRKMQTNEAKLFFLQNYSWRSSKSVYRNGSIYIENVNTNILRPGNMNNFISYVY